MPDSTPARTAGHFTLPGTGRALHRLGYGAMQLAGRGVWGPPNDEAAAIAILREAIALGVNHIDTSDFYGPHVTNRLIREALAPYPESLTIVTKVGYRRGENRSWHPAFSADDIARAIDENLENLGLDALDVVNLRVGGPAAPIESDLSAPLTALAGLQREGLIRHLGVSNVTPVQLTQARSIADIVCVQNHYNLAHRTDDLLIDELAAAGIAYVPFFPLGGFKPVQSAALEAASTALGATPMQIALAWLLQRSPNILLIPGTSSLAHLRENLAAAALTLPPDLLVDLDAIASPADIP